MRHIVLVLAGLFAVSLGTAFGQGAPPFYSVGGFGSVVNPGIGHPPTLPFGAATGTGPLFPTRLGANVAGHPFGFSGGGGGRFDHGGPHNRTVIVPYPIYYGGYGGGYGNGYGYDAPPPVDQNGNPIVNTNTAPSVVINQNFAPERPSPMVREYGAPGPDGVEQQSSSGMRMYQAPPSHPYADAQPQAEPQTHAPRSAANDDQPTLYLIAFKDHSIVQALGYWMESNTLHYVSVEHSLNQASLDLIDRSLSQRLNDERGVEFKLPK
jgi:hypothetical protein